MAFIPVSQAILVEIRGTYHQQEVENTIWLKTADAVDQGEVDDAASVVYAWWTAHVLPLLSNEYELREVYASDQSTNTGPTSTVTPASAAVGGLLTQGNAANVSLAISFRSNGRGRSSRGRNYVVGIPESQTQESRVLSSYANNLRLAYSALLPMLPDVSLVWVVASRFHNNAPRSLGITYPVVAVVLSDNDVDSQRRRLRGRGK